MIDLYALAALAVLILDAAVILHILGAPVRGVVKLLWSALVLLLPAAGAALWWFAGPRAKRRDVVEREPVSRRTEP